MVRKVFLVVTILLLALSILPSRGNQVSDIINKLPQMTDIDRGQAIEKLAKMSRSIESEVLDGLGSDSEVIRYYSAIICRQIYLKNPGVGNYGWVDCLGNSIEDDSSRVKLVALQAFQDAPMGDVVDVSESIQKATLDPDPKVRQVASLLIRKIDDYAKGNLMLTAILVIIFLVVIVLVMKLSGD